MPKSPYSAVALRDGGAAVAELSDASREMRVRVATSLGCLAYEFSVRGKNVLWFPHANPDGVREDAKLCGVPFLAPWANRIYGDGYWVNGRRYVLNAALGNLRRDSHQSAIHGLLLFSPDWQVVSLGADEHSAFLTCRLEFWKIPELMAQFPFAHEIGITHKLSAGSLEVEVSLYNLAREPMPVAVGFHPYFQLHDSHRDEWKVEIAAREHAVLNEFLIPTGERRPMEFAKPHALREGPLDDVFANLVRGEDGKARFSVMGTQEKLTVVYGPQYEVAVIYAPAAKDFICFEPMAATTNAFNLAYKGLATLQTIPPGAQWHESFWVIPENF